MTTIGIGLLVILGLFVALMVGMQLAVQARARALAGTPVPPLPGTLGARVTRPTHALVYFFSPMCGACRALTPRVRALGEKNDAVFAVDVSQEESIAVARALRILATPSTVEIADGKIRGMYIGSIPDEVLARFA